MLAALRRRELTGDGELIEISLLDSAFAALVNAAQNALVTGEDPPRYGNAHPSIVPYQPFRAADGFVAVAAANDGLYSRLCDAIGRPELARDERYATNEARVRNRTSLVAELAHVFASRPSEEWVRLLFASGVPAERSAASATHCAPRPPRERRRRARSPTRQPAPSRSSSRRSRSHAHRPREAPPLLGQHTAEVLGELGVDDERLSDLERRGAIVRAGPA
jgi:crotonobetainyl-CoA:carnitine CoA-transferase CaiB-like acyl-CoA transferase